MVIDMYEFTEDCITGIEEIDREHEHLFQVINEAYGLLNTANNHVVMVRGLVKELKKYAAVHFEHEEAYMNKINDPELPRQKREHEAFTKKVNEIYIDDLNEEESKKMLEDLLLFLSNWLYRHILGSDIMIGKMGTVQTSLTSSNKQSFQFTQEYKTNIDFIDEEHKQLFQIIQNVYDIIHMEYVHDKFDRIVHVLNDLKDYTDKHFSDEEEYMERIQYKDIEVQRLAHRAFIEKLNQVDLELVDDNQQEYLEELIDFLLEWLKNHILKMDKKIPAEES